MFIALQFTVHLGCWLITKNWVVEVVGVLGFRLLALVVVGGIRRTVEYNCAGG